MRLIDFGRFNIPFSEAPSPTQWKHLTQSFFALEKTLRGHRGGTPEKI